MRRVLTILCILLGLATIVAGTPQVWAGGGPKAEHSDVHQHQHPHHHDAASDSAPADAAPVHPLGMACCAGAICAAVAPVNAATLTGTTAYQAAPLRVSHEEALPPLAVPPPLRPPRAIS